MSDWQLIESAPKDRYIEITDGLCIQDIVSWHPRRAAYTDKHGTVYSARPSGWFSINLGRSRLDANAKFWAELRPLPDLVPSTADS